MYPELLAPVGEPASLHAAIAAGADAVYFGLSSLNLRAKTAHSFLLRDLPGIAATCSSAGRRAWLTLNTTLFDGELPEARTIIDAVKDSGINGVIVSDPAALTYCLERGVEAHISTQISVSNLEAVRFYSRWADRMVLARELDLARIRAIVEGIESEDIRGPSGRPVEIEVFAHGALCVAVSGRCYMSLYQYNHSANRGECLQPCRRTYRVTDDETGDELVVDHQFVMSPNDLCTLPFLDRVVASGVKVLKLEGRTRSPEYVSTVTSVYREALDAIAGGQFSQALVAPLMERLRTVYNRGFGDGFFLGYNGDQWAAKYGSRATRRKLYSARVVHFYAKPMIAEVLVESLSLSVGDDVLIIGPTSGVVQFKVSEMRVDEQPAANAGKRQLATIPVPLRVRENDRLYIHVPSVDTPA